jgi:hypothetical protein
MDRLDQLKEVTSHVMSGLKADEKLKNKILLSYSEGAERTGKKPFGFRTVVALCSLSVLLILLCVFAAKITSGAKNPDLQVIPAGNRYQEAPVNLQPVIDKAAELMMEDAEGR